MEWGTEGLVTIFRRKEGVAPPNSDPVREVAQLFYACASESLRIMRPSALLGIVPTVLAYSSSESGAPPRASDVILA